jgi:oligopeptide/dipeptide ABC transporter ATP-binding protein
VADEPVSALDVSVQAQVLALLAELCARNSVALLFISHDLPVVRSLCERVVVLYLGRVMEEGPSAAVLARPLHPYTRALLSAAPSIDPARRRRRILLDGDPPSPASPSLGLRLSHPMPACHRRLCRSRPGAAGTRARASSRLHPRRYRLGCRAAQLD